MVIESLLFFSISCWILYSKSTSFFNGVGIWDWSVIRWLESGLWEDFFLVFGGFSIFIPWLYSDSDFSSSEMPCYSANLSRSFYQAISYYLFYSSVILSIWDNSWPLSTSSLEYLPPFAWMWFSVSGVVSYVVTCSWRAYKGLGSSSKPSFSLIWISAKDGMFYSIIKSSAFYSLILYYFCSSMCFWCCSYFKCSCFYLSTSLSYSAMSLWNSCSFLSYTSRTLSYLLNTPTCGIDCSGGVELSCFGLSGCY